MLWLVTSIFTWLRSFFRSRHDLGLEIIALRHQLTVLKRSTRRARLHPTDRLFWVCCAASFQAGLGRFFSLNQRRWWRGIERLFAPIGGFARGPKESEGRAFPVRFGPWSSTWRRENPTWGAPRIHGELWKLGVPVSERTVSRYLARLRRNINAGQRWRTFLNNHRDAIVGMDFFTVITLNFRILYSLFLIHHGRREILHFNSTEHPTSEWIVQQLREAFPDGANRYVIFDRDKKFGDAVHEFLGSCGIAPVMH
jgi:putative transposase